MCSIYHTFMIITYAFLCQERKLYQEISLNDDDEKLCYDFVVDVVVDVYHVVQLILPTSN